MQNIINSASIIVDSAHINRIEHQSTFETLRYIVSDDNIRTLVAFHLLQ